MSRAPFVAFLVACVLAAAEPSAAARSIVDRNYDCTIIASTREFPLGVDSLGPPAMNAWGQVVFATRAIVGDDTIFELRVGRGELTSGGVPISHAVAKARRDLHWAARAVRVDREGRDRRRRARDVPRL